MAGYPNFFPELPSAIEYMYKFRKELPMKENEEIVINSLSTSILRVLREVSHEEICPNADPDRMDEIIKDGYKKVRELRRIRQELEDIFTGVCGEREHQHLDSIAEQLMRLKRGDL